MLMQARCGKGGWQDSFLFKNDYFSVGSAFKALFAVWSYSTYRERPNPTSEKHRTIKSSLIIFDYLSQSLIKVSAIFLPPPGGK